MGKEPSIDIGNSQGRRILDGVGGFTTSIGTGCIFKGSLSGEGHSIILGRVEGNSELNGTLVVGDGGIWIGDIVAESVVIAGRVEGSITARKKIEIVSTAIIQGSLTSPIIAIAEGAVHNGDIHMAEVTRFTDQRD